MERKITAFYKFIKIQESEINRVQSDLLKAGELASLTGLIILASEGVNGTISSTPLELENFKLSLAQILKCSNIQFKNSWAEKNPFRRFKVKIRPEIVTIGDPNLHPGEGKNNHLTPTEWNNVIENEDVILIDTRNQYETELGKFNGALDPNLNTFQDFANFVDAANLPKDKKILMYCTGGIRCEKAILEMQRKGYENVFQLEGGILKYIEEYPNKYYQGECFVFDHRVSVDQDLTPSKKFHLCAHCGNPGDQIIPCQNCSSPSKICTACSNSPHLLSCSKNCSYHLNLII